MKKQNFQKFVLNKSFRFDFDLDSTPVTSSVERCASRWTDDDGSDEHDDDDTTMSKLSKVII